MPERKSMVGESPWSTGLLCSSCDREAPLDRPEFLCSCGKPWLVDYRLDPAVGGRWRQALSSRPWSLWRYRELLPVEDFQSRVDLGEGGTPLVSVRGWGPSSIDLWIKQESSNPTGSFKDRGLSLAVNRARELGAPGVQLASAGNAAISLTTYAAAAGIPARVALPEDTPRTVFERCRLMGAEVLSSAGTLVDAGEQLAKMGGDFWTLSTLKEPYRVEGKKTMGLELAEQFAWKLPDWIVYPTGGGTGIIGMYKAFHELEQLGLIDARRPRFAVVQMEGCAPIVRAFEAHAETAEPWEDARTSVWGLRVPKAIGDFLILAAVRESGGTALAVEEAEIEPMTRELARKRGLLVGPEGAACFLAVRELHARGLIEGGHSVVIFQTGHPANYV